AAAALWAETQQRFTETVGLAAPDDRTLVVRLARRTPYFLELCAFATFMPAHAASIESTATLRPETAMRREGNWTQPGTLISNGAYQLDQWLPKQYLML